MIETFGWLRGGVLHELADDWGVGARDGAQGKGVWFTMQLPES